MKSYMARLSEKVFWLFLQLLSETFLILKITSRCYHKCTYTLLHVKYPFFLSDFNDTWIFSTSFGRMLTYKITWISIQGEPSCSTRTDGHDQAYSRFSQFCERVYKPKFIDDFLVNHSQIYCNWYYSLECLHRGSSLWNNVAALSNFKYLWNIIRHTIVQNRAKLLTILMPTGAPSLASCASTWLSASGGESKIAAHKFIFKPFQKQF